MVICADDFFTGTRRNIEAIEAHGHFTLLQHDVTDPLSLDVDEIYNLACPASRSHYRKAPIRTLKSSVYGAANMLDLAKRANAKIMQASTSEIYGDPAVHR
jgi:UDP-glucuronate decarboxylase